MQIATTQEKLDGMKANWQNERGAIDLVLVTLKS